MSRWLLHVTYMYIGAVKWLIEVRQQIHVIPRTNVTFAVTPGSTLYQRPSG